MTWVPSRDASSSRARIESGPGLGQRRVQLRHGRLVGVRGGGQLQPAPRVRGVHRAPLAQPGHHQLRDQRHRQVHVERLGEQLTGLGQERQPGLPAQVGAAQPVVLQVQREPLGDDGGQRLGVADRARRPAPARPAYGRCTVSGTRMVAASSRGARPYRASNCRPVPSPRSSRTTPPAAPVSRASRDSRSMAKSARPSSVLRSGSICSSAVSAPTLGVSASSTLSAGTRRAGAGAAPALQPEPDALAGALVHGAPAAGEVVDQQQPATTLRNLADVHGLVLRADRELLDRAGGEVGHRDGEAGRVGGDLDVQLGVGVHHRVRGEFGGQQQRLVEQGVQPGLLEHRADQGARGGRRPPVVGQPDAPHEGARSLRPPPTRLHPLLCRGFCTKPRLALTRSREG